MSLSAASGNVPTCLLCGAPISNSKLRRNISHGEEGLQRKEVLEGLMREFLRESRPIITPRRQRIDFGSPSRDPAAKEKSVHEATLLKDSMVRTPAPRSTLFEASRPHSCPSDTDIQAYFRSSNVVCKDGCYSWLSKYIKLQQDMESLHDKLLGLVQRSALTFLKTSATLNSMLTTTQSSSSSSRKRRTSDISSPTKRLKREMPTTPVRQFVKNAVVVGNHPVCAIVRKGKKGTRIMRLTESLHKLGNAIGKRKRNSIAYQVMKDSRLVSIIVPKIGRKIRNELVSSISNNQLLFLDSSVKSMQSFSWKTLSEGLKQTNPLLSALLMECINANRSKLRKPDPDVLLCVIAGVLLRNCNQNANLLQTIFSIILYASHVPKQVYTRFQKACLCLSHKSTVSIVDKLGSDHDKDVMKWKQKLFEKISADNERSAEAEKSVGQIANQVPPDDGCLDIERRVQQILDGGELLHAPTLNNSTEDDHRGSDLDSLPEDALSSSTELEVCSPVLTESDHCQELDLSFGSFLELECNLSFEFPSISTFKIVGDNLDIYIKPRSETLSCHADSKHFFHMFAVKDRIDNEMYNDSTETVDMESVDVSSVLPTEDDLIALKKNLGILVCRLVRRNMPYFRKHICTKTVPAHIEHEFSIEMSQKSEVVPLGVLMKNENKTEDMVSIMEFLLKYVPSLAVIDSVTDPDTNETVTLKRHKIHPLLFGGDQLTTERARSCRRSRSNADEAESKLQGLIPVVEDWHSKVALLKVIWKRLYNTSSSTDCCTLYHLRNLLQRRSVTKKVKNDPTASEEFFLLVAESYILYAVMHSFKMESLESAPSHEKFFNFESHGKIQREKLFTEMISSVIDNHFNFGKSAKNDCSSVLSYAEETFSLGLFLFELIDSIHEGDGNRIIRCWKYLLLMYKSSNKVKYSVEAFSLLAHYQFIFGERLKRQLLWSRTINMHGKPGKNIPMDLFMEHLNRNFKDSISQLGSNLMDSTLQRTGKALKPLRELLLLYDLVTNISHESMYHTFQSNAKDRSKVIEELQKAKVYDAKSNQKLTHSADFKGSVMDKVDMDELKGWMTTQLKKIIRYSV